MLRSLTFSIVAISMLIGAQSSTAGLLAPSDAGDPSIPDLVYHSLTGEVFLDVDSSPGIVGYVLKNTTNSFFPANHTQLLAGVVTSITSEVSEAAFASAVGSNSIGLVFPTGLNLAGLTALLSTNDVSTGLGSPIVPFDLVVITAGTGPTTGVPEPATFAMAAMGLFGMGLYSWRRRRNMAA